MKQAMLDKFVKSKKVTGMLKDLETELTRKLKESEFFHEVENIFREESNTFLDANYKGKIENEYLCCFAILALRQITGKDYAFVRDENVCGLVNRLDNNDYLLKFEMG